MEEKEEAECASSKPQGHTKPVLPVNRHRIHRSSVRPFFCCGSQVSLNSITETKELPVLPEKDDNDYTDVSDTDELIDDLGDLDLDNQPCTVSLPQITKSSPSKVYQGSPRLGTNKHRKAVVIQDKNGRKKFWTLKLRRKLQVSKPSAPRFGSDSEISHKSKEGDGCICTSYRRTSQGQRNETENTSSGACGHSLDLPFSMLTQCVPAPDAGPSTSKPPSKGAKGKGKGKSRKNRRDESKDTLLSLNELYPINDIDEQRYAQRRKEMEEGIELRDVRLAQQLVNKDEGSTDNLCDNVPAFAGCGERSVGQYPLYGAMGLISSTPNILPEGRSSFDGTGVSVMEQSFTGSVVALNESRSPWFKNIPHKLVHTQVDYIHFLVPDLQKITNSSFYWGIMDRYQAEKLIENKPEGTFLLRDSAQDEFLFSVSFRRYGRSLHARIEQWDHKFSFDSRDPGVFSTDSVCGLIDHYKDPSSCMFFEPMLTLPLNRSFPFSLQHLCRSVICSRITYDSIGSLPLPRSLRDYLKYYHYKQKVRVRCFDTST